MKYLNHFFFDNYIHKIIKVDLIYKYNKNLYLNFLLFLKFYIVYVNYGRYGVEVLVRIYKILRDNYNFIVALNSVQKKKYLKGRIIRNIVSFKYYIYQIDILFLLNYLCSFLYRLILKYNGLFLFMENGNDQYKILDLYWNDFFTRLIQIKEAILNQKNIFFRIDYYNVTLNLSLFCNINIINIKEENFIFFFNFLSFLGFYLPIKNVKFYQFFIRLI